tara:strand:- start:481 stop:744 length:264 start_codon:yes stop_codon:yes gene_type:complete
MCIFRAPRPTPQATPQAIIPRQKKAIEEKALPTKKELLDPEEVAGVEYGTTAKADPAGAAKRTGTDALKINIGTGGETGSASGGLNV